jgi:hypothetical protein
VAVIQRFDSALRLNVHGRDRQAIVQANSTIGECSLDERTYGRRVEMKGLAKRRVWQR